MTPEAANGNFSIVPLWDYLTCNGAQCVPFAGSLMPVSRLDQFWVRVAGMLPEPSARTSPGPNASMQVSGCLADLQGSVGGSRFVIDGETNRLFSLFGGIVQIPWGPFATRVSRFKLYVDGAQAAWKDVTYGVPYRH